MIVYVKTAESPDRMMSTQDVWSLIQSSQNIELVFRWNNLFSLILTKKLEGDEYSVYLDCYLRPHSAKGFLLESEFDLERVLVRLNADRIYESESEERLYG